MWRTEETEIERLRGALGNDPAGTRDRITAALGESRFQPAEQIRLWGLMVAACTYMGEFEQAMDAFRRGQLVQSREPSARAELYGQAARCLGSFGQYEQARAMLADAAELLQPLLSTPPGRSKQSRRRYERLRSLFASLFVISGNASLYEGDYYQALEYGKKALQHAPPSSMATLAAATLIGATIAGEGKGVVSDLEEVIPVIFDALENKPPELHSIKLHWVRALILARFGADHLAEKIMLRVLRALERLGVYGELAHATEHLVWIVAHRNADPGRAQYLLQQMSGALDATTRAKLREQLREEIRAESAPPPARVLGW